jgi:hypothetical protein
MIVGARVRVRFHGARLWYTEVLTITQTHSLKLIEYWQPDKCWTCQIISWAGHETRIHIKAPTLAELLQDPHWPDVVAAVASV